MKEFKTLMFISLLILASFVFAEKIVPLPDLTKAEGIQADGGQIIVTSFPQVFIYNLKDFKLLTKFGKAGEGPQEFFRFVKAQFHPTNPDWVIVGSHDKMSFYTRKGEYVKDFRSKYVRWGDCLWPVADNYVGTLTTLEKGTNEILCLNLFGPDLQQKKEFIRWEGCIGPFASKRINPSDSTFSGGEYTIYDNKIFVLLRVDKGNIEVFDSEGNKLYTINHGYKRIPLKKSDRDAFNKFIKEHPRFSNRWELFKDAMNYPEYFPATRAMAIANDKIYVFTNNRIPEENKYEVVIFDIKGKFLKNTMVPFYKKNIQEHFPFSIYNGKLYQLVENENKEKKKVELHISNIE